MNSSRCKGDNGGVGGKMFNARWGLEHYMAICSLHQICIRFDATMSRGALASRLSHLLRDSVPVLRVVGEG